MAKFLGLSNSKWLSIILLLCVIIISLIFSLMMNIRPVLQEGLLEESKVDKVNCEFRKYVELVEALCNFHITGNTPTGNTPNLSPYMLKDNTYLLNLGLSASDSSVDSEIMEQINVDNISYTEKMKRVYKVYSEKKESIDNKGLLSLMNTHYSNRLTILSSFLMDLSKMISSENQEDTNLSNKITLAIDNPKVFSNNAALEKPSFEDLYNAFKSQYEDKFTSGYSCS
tara:strand:+ start:2756 stop:3436 length:681 start_codon:yes stop_codon:yes gene_type:complete